MAWTRDFKPVHWNGWAGRRLLVSPRFWPTGLSTTRSADAPDAFRTERLAVTQLRTRLRQVAEMPEAFLCTRAGEGDLHARNQAYIRWAANGFRDKTTRLTHAM